MGGGKRELWNEKEKKETFVVKERGGAGGEIRNEE